jgi:porphyrinogen peroxidase
MTKAQAGIFREGTRHHYFLEYVLETDATPDDLRRALRAALESVTREAEGQAPEVVVAFGPLAWMLLSPDEAPEQLRSFSPVEGPDGLHAPATQHDIFVWVHGDRVDEVFWSAMVMHREIAPLASLRLEEPGFTFRDMRDLGGFVDGSANPKGEDRLPVALIPEGEACAGGSYVLGMRWIHDLASFHELSVEEQERVIGRTKADSVEFEGDAMPEDAHVARTDRKRDGVTQKLYRRSTPIGSVDAHGLYFLAFCCDPSRFEFLLESMYGVDGGPTDRLLSFSTPTTGSLFFAPSAAQLEELLR